MVTSSPCHFNLEVVLIRALRSPPPQNEGALSAHMPVRMSDRQPFRCKSSRSLKTIYKTIIVVMRSSIVSFR